MPTVTATQRRQLWFVALFVTFMAAVTMYAQGQPTPVREISGDWLKDIFALPNLIAAGTLLFHFGMLRQQFGEHGRRITGLEEWREKIEQEQRQAAFQRANYSHSHGKG